MAFLQLSKISLAFGDRDILKSADLRIGSGDRIALSGANGSGKSSLLKIAAGLSSADSGQCSSSPGARITYLPQTGIRHSGKPLWDAAEEAFAHVVALLGEKAAVEEELASLKEGDPRIEELLHTQHDLEERIELSAYYRREQRIEEVLTGLGFQRSDFEKRTEAFSGGWQMRIALAQALLTSPDLLLLDEPTNYLDIEARDWLQQFLASFAGGMVLVSHDRHFLDACVNRVCELFLGRLRVYQGNYSAYLRQRSAELEQLQKAYEEQQAEIERLENFISRFRYNSSKAALVQSRVKQLEKIELIEIPESMKHVHFRFPDPPHSGKKVIRLHEGAKSYGEHQVFTGVELEIERGEKIALTGKNGAGKSTLMRILAGVDSDFEGELKLGTGVKIGYFSQDVENRFTEERTIYDEVEAEAPTELIPSLRGLLGAFLFRGDDIYKSVQVLSGGEKSRLALLKLLLNPVNLLVLDEPTNHLDLQTKDVLLDVLKTYSGTVVFVSHDRYFLEELATGVYEIEDGRGRLFPGDYAYYRSQAERYRTDAESRTATEPSTEEKSSNQLQREELKSLQAEARRLERREATLMEEIEEIDRRIEKLHQDLADPEVYSNPLRAAEVQKEIDTIEKESQTAHTEWEKAAEGLAAVQDSINAILSPASR